MGNRVAKAALDAVVGVVGAETGCPEIDDGRTLDREDQRRTRHTETWRKQRHTNSQQQSGKRDRDRKKEHWFEAAHL